jgi:hypothetical protein
MDIGYARETIESAASGRPLGGRCQEAQTFLGEFFLFPFFPRGIGDPLMLSKQNRFKSFKQFNRFAQFKTFDALRRFEVQEFKETLAVQAVPTVQPLRCVQNV